MKKPKLIDIAPTSNVVRLQDAYGFLGQTRPQTPKMLAIFGQPGLGKSQACEFVARQGGIFYFEVPVNPSPYGFISALALAMGVGCGPSFHATLTKVMDAVRSGQTGLCFDEAGRLFYKQRDQLAEVCRYIHDTAGVPVVLSGMPDLKASLTRYPQLADRVHFLEFLPWSVQDCELVAAQCFAVTVEADLIAKIHQATKGNGRLVSRALEHVERHASVLGLPKINATQWGNQPFLPA